jgi:hypothetical protein
VVTHASIDAVLNTDAKGGYLIASISCVHTHECPFWRNGKRHAPCNCGANALIEVFKKNHTAMPWHGVIEILRAKHSPAGPATALGGG